MASALLNQEIGHEMYPSTRGRIFAARHLGGSRAPPPGFPPLLLAVRIVCDAVPRRSEVSKVNALLESLKASILDHHPLRSPRKRRVELLLGNDREIGRETHSQERRAGITPDHGRALSGFFADLRVELSVLVMRGAGERAG